MKRILYSRRARQDLVEIFVWIAREDSQAAERVLSRIEAAIEGLADFQTGRRGRLKNTFDKVVAGQPYIATYRIDRATITIVTIRHTSRRPLG